MSKEKSVGPLVNALLTGMLFKDGSVEKLAHSLKKTRWKNWNKWNMVWKKH